MEKKKIHFQYVKNEIGSEVILKLAEKSQLNGAMKKTLSYVVTNDTANNELALNILKKKINTEEEIYEFPLVEFFYDLLSPLNKKVFEKIVQMKKSIPYSENHYNTRGYRTKTSYGERKYYIYILLEIYINEYLNHNILSQLNRETIYYKDQEIDFGYNNNINATYLGAITSIEEGKEAFQYLKSMIYDNENIVNLSYNIIRALVISENKESNVLLLDLLKAARLSEGLRSSIVESIDMGSLDTFKFFLSYIREEKLVRFSSVKRAFLCYVGWEYESGKTDSMEKVGEYILACLLDNKIEEYLNSDNALKYYIALYSMGCNEVEDAITYCVNNIETQEDYKKIASMMFLSRMRKPISLKTINNLLRSNNVHVFMHLSSIYINESEEISLEVKREFIDLVCKRLKPLKAKDFRLVNLDDTGSSPLYSHSYYMKAYGWAHQMDEKYEEVYSLFDKYFHKNVYAYNYETGVGRSQTLTYVEDRIENPIIKEAIISSITKNQRHYSFEVLNKKFESLSEEDFLSITDGFKSKRSDVRQSINTLLSKASEEIIIKCARELILDKNVEKRSGGISLLKENHEKIKERKEFSEIKEILKDVALPTEVAQVRDEILNDGVTKNEEWFFDIEYKLPLPKIIEPSLEEIKKIKDLFISAINKITGSDSNKITLKDIEACIEKYVSIFKSHEGEEIEYYQGYGSESKISGKVGYEFRVNYGFYGDKYDDYKNYPFYEEYINLVKNLTTEEYLVYKIITDFIGTVNYVGYGNYVNSNMKKIYLSKVIEEIIDFSIMEIRDIEEKEKVIHFKNYNEMIGKYMKESQKENIYQDENIQNIILNILLVYLKNTRDFLSKEGDKLKEKIEKEAKKISDDRQWGNEYEISKIIIATPDYYDALASKILNPEIEIKDTKKDESVFLNLLHIAEKEKRTYDYLDINLLHWIEKGRIKEDYIYNEVLVNYNHSLYASLFLIVNFDKRRTKMTSSEEIKNIAKRIYDKIANKMIEIELERSESPTPYSGMVENKSIVENSEVFVKTIYKLGKTPFTRGYSWSSGNSMKDVFSSLISKTLPEKDFDLENYSKLLKKYKFSEQKLLEASMYNLKFIPYTEEYLGMKGLTKCAYYFRAHMNDYFDDETNKIINRYSDIDSKDFANGQMDLDWFRESFEELGEKNFYKLYEAAKYITDGGKHKRAQYFADAVLGKLNLDEVEARINDKRNQEMILAYGLIPFGEDKLNDAIRRYKRLQGFLKESKQFGAQRKASEALKVSIAMNNLARNYGYKDSARFSWGMEIEMYKEMLGYFSPNVIEDIKVYISLENIEKPRIVAIKDEKELKSLPAKYNKNEYVLELKEAQKSLKDQFKRARTSLENVMIYEDELEIEELLNLQKHPIISSLLSSLIFVAGKNIGLLRENTLVDANGKVVKIKAKTKLKIVHPIVLFENKTWEEWQNYLMKEKIIQPFKQVFREVYLPTKDEEKEDGSTYRFAGYQIEKNRAMGVLKTRSWLISEYQGFEKVNHKDNIRIDLYSYADWYMPSEIESPTIEKIQFVDNKTNKNVKITDISKVLYSETMRDMDLVVSVAYVGGVDPMLNHSTIEMRKRILEHNLDLFSIKNYSFDGNHIIIKGKLNEYSLHLGSGVIHTKNKGMLPVFPVHSQQRGHIFLPFIDSDPKTSEIISKVLMLAEDNKIKDPTVLVHLR